MGSLATVLVLVLAGALGKTQAGEYQNVECRLDCRTHRRRPNSCYTNDVHWSNYSNEDETSKPPPAPSSCAIEYYLKRSKKYNSSLAAYLSFTWTLPPVRDSVRIDKFIVSTSSLGLNMRKHELYLPDNLPYWKKETRVTAKMCSERLEVDTSYLLQVTTSPFHKPTKSHQTCKAERTFHREVCCEKDMKKTKLCQRAVCKEETTTQYSLWTPGSIQSEKKVFIVEQGEVNYYLIVICVSLFFVSLLVFGLVMHRFRSKKDQLRNSGCEGGRSAVVLVSSGDDDRRYAELANAIADEMRSRYDEVHFSGWRREGKVEEMLDAIQHCALLLFISTPHGKISYEELLERGAESTWKDQFVIGAHAVFRNSSGPACFQSPQKILVAYCAEDDDDRDRHLHRDFVSTDGKHYNLERPLDRATLLSNVCGGSKKSWRHNQDALLLLLATNEDNSEKANGYHHVPQIRIP